MFYFVYSKIRYGITYHRSTICSKDYTIHYSLFSVKDTIFSNYYFKVKMLSRYDNCHALKFSNHEDLKKFYENFKYKIAFN